MTAVHGGVSIEIVCPVFIQPGTSPSDKTLALVRVLHLPVNLTRDSSQAPKWEVAGMVETYIPYSAACVSPYLIPVGVWLSWSVLPNFVQNRHRFVCNFVENICLAATMASGDVDLCLVPESPIVLEGPNGCIPHLMKRVSRYRVQVTPMALGFGAIGKDCDIYYGTVLDERIGRRRRMLEFRYGQFLDQTARLYVMLWYVCVAFE